MARPSLAVSGLVAILAFSASARADDPARRCATAKMLLAAKKIVGRTTCDARATAKGTDVDPVCAGRTRTRFVGRWSKIEARGGCATTGDRDAIEAKVDAQDAALRDQLRAGAPASRCTSGKLKHAGKHGACDLRCGKAGALPATDPRTARCRGKCSTRYERAFGKDEAKRDCHSTGDVNAIDSIIDAFVDDVVAELWSPGSTTTTTRRGTTTTAPSTSTTTTTALPSCGGVFPACLGSCPPGQTCSAVTIAQACSCM